MKKIENRAAYAMLEGQPIVALSTVIKAATFADLILLSGGRYPTELLQFLRACDGLEPTLQHRVQDLIADATTSVRGNDHPQGSGLALPHPIDAEWRFTDRTADGLLAAASNATKPGDKVLLMGVPSVVIAALRSNHDRYFQVVGEHNIISEELRALTASDSRFAPMATDKCLVAAAILDPPWYPEQFCDMLAQAASRCGIGAYLFVSAPSEGVRPSIPDDLRHVAEIATRSGLELVSQSIGKLEYRTPLFELNALRASGIGAWLPEWRRGDQRVYRKSHSGGLWASKLPDQSGFELTIAGVRLRLLDVALDQATADLIPIYSGEIFPSVSMRSPRRSEAVLWTSGNRAFSVNHTACLAALVAIAKEKRLLPKGLDAKISSARNHQAVDRIEPLIHKLLELADREFAEAAIILGSKAWETAANDARFLSASRRAPP